MNFKEDLLKENIILSDVQLDNFDKLYNLLVIENEKTNLTRITSKEDVYYLHFYDSLMASLGIKEENKDVKLIDIGAGPGFPSLPLKIGFPSLDITIVEATNKKVEFIKKVISELNLSNINPIHSRAEDFKELNKYDYATTRAVSTIKEQLPYTIPFLKINGCLISMKGELKAQSEIDEAKELLNEIGAKVDRVIKYNVLDRNYCLVIIKKIKPTPKKYPISLHRTK